MSTPLAHSAETPRSLPEVILEVRQGSGRQVNYTLGNIDFLIGTVPGCDLRVPGAELPALVCVAARYPGGVHLRKLAPVQVLLLNGETTGNCDLGDGDRLTIGAVDIVFRIRELAIAAPAPGIEQQATATDAAAAARAAELALFEERRRQLEAEVQELLQVRAQAQQQRDDALARAQEARAAEIEWLGEQLEQDKRAFEEAQAGIQEREEKLAQGQRELQADLVRLHRQQGQIEERDQGLRQMERDLEERWAAMQRTSGELEGQVAQLDQWRLTLEQQAEGLAAQQRTQDELAAQLAQRAASLEGQQAALASLRARLERQRAQVREDEQQLEAERARREAEAAEWSQKWQELQRERLQIDSERHVHAQERDQWAQRSAVLESAVHQLRQAQEHLAQEQERSQRQTEELAARARQCAEQEGILDSRLAQLAEAQQRLEAERQALRERTLAVVQGEQAREALQEQLRRRADDLAARQKQFADEEQAYRERAALIDQRSADLEQRDIDSRRALEARQLELDGRAQTMAQQETELAAAEDRYKQQLEEIAALRRELAEQRLAFQEEQQRTLERQAQARSDFLGIASEAHELSRQLPDLELRATTALDRLGHARAQLRHHLAEVHQYVRGCQDDLEQWRTRLRGELEKVQAEEQALGRRQEEQRLAMAGFRQQLIDWQGQIADMKRVLARDGTRLQRKEAHVAEQVRAIDATSERLAREAESLQEQQRQVIDRRQEIDGHLSDMCDWYRQKLRDLAGITVSDDAAPEPVILKADIPASEPPADENDDGIIPTQRSILTLGAIDPGDQRLADLLGALQLSDADTLTALLAEARRQRRSLRQVLLASGVVTLYQLALIEAGNVTALMLGPVRVIDRLRATPHETIYRVFDPRRGAEAVLRHLAEAALQDALRPDEYRQRFGQAMLSDPHVAATLQILDIQGRPAVLQEWLTGLPATDWPPLAAAPGVCYRLLTQAALGLAAAHGAGLVHGRLRDSLVLLTGEGVLKLCGLGEPPWLHNQTDEEADVRGDLRALGRMASGWCTHTGVRRGAKARPLPEALVSILYRLAADGDAGYRDVSELLTELEGAAAAIPANAEAWDRLLKYVREHGTAEAMLRQSA